MMTRMKNMPLFVALLMLLASCRQSVEPIVYTTTSTLKAGFDLSEMTDDDIKCNPRTRHISITLPAPKLLSLTMKPQDIYSESSWCGSPIRCIGIRCSLLLGFPIRQTMFYIKVGSRVGYKIAANAPKTSP